MRDPDCQSRSFERPLRSGLEFLEPDLESRSWNERLRSSPEFLEPDLESRSRKDRLRSSPEFLEPRSKDRAPRCPSEFCLEPAPLRLFPDSKEPDRDGPRDLPSFLETSRSPRESFRLSNDPLEEGRLEPERPAGREVRESRFTSDRPEDRPREGGPCRSLEFRVSFRGSRPSRPPERFCPEDLPPGLRPELPEPERERPLFPSELIRMTLLFLLQLPDTPFPREQDEIHS